MFALIDHTAAKTWQYESEAQLKTVARLYAVQHPAASISVVIGGQTHKLR